MEPATSVIQCESDMAKKCEFTVYANCRKGNSENSQSADELFSDAEDKKGDLTYYSPEVPKGDQSSLNLSDLPAFLTDKQATTPNTAVIPSTPLSLIPFLTRVNEQWSSELETPQSERTNQRIDPAAKSKESAEKVAVSKPPSASMSQTKNDGEYICLSPVIKSKKPKRRLKRRIFKSMHSPESIPQVPKNEPGINNPNTDLTICGTTENTSHLKVIENNISDYKESNTDGKNDINTESSHNTSTQNFFNNMSFTNIDKICAENFDVHNIRSGNIDHENNTMTKLQSERTDIVNRGGNISDVLPNIAQKNLPIEFGFQTASGKAINISKSALAKVQSLFGDDFDDSTAVPTVTVPKKDDGDKAYSLFQFASGKPVKLNAEALKKAETLFTNELYEKENENTLNVKHNSTLLKKVEVSNYKKKDKNIDQVEKTVVGFQPVCDRPVSVSKTAIEKVRTIFSKDINNDEERSMPMDKRTDFPNIGFQTAGGRPITVTKAALQKVSSLFQEDIEESNDKKSSAKNYLNNITKTNISKSSFGFQTASGHHIAVSETALQKAKSLFVEDTEHLAEKEDSKEDRLNHIKTNKRSHSGLGFETASGRPIAVSETALKKVKLLFSEVEHLEEKEESTRRSLNSVTNNKPSHFGCGFQTASGREISVSETALQKVKSLFHEELLEDVGNTSTKSEPLSKRKTSEPDEDTPLRKKSNTNFKKLRFNSELPARKLTYENGKDDLSCTKAQGRKQENSQNQSNRNNSNPLTNNNCLYGNTKINNEKTCGDSISEEILASTEALLADEVKSVPVPKTPSSPVIGRQLDARRKRNLTLRNRNLNRLSTNRTNSENAKKQNIEPKSREERIVGKEEKAQIGSNYGDTQWILNFIDNSAIILEKRREAAVEQDTLIKQKTKNKPKSQAGRLFTYKQLNQKNRLTWKKVSNGNAPVPRSLNELVSMRVPPETLNVTARTAVDYRFRCSDFYGHHLVQDNTDGIDIGENTKLILDENGYAGIREIKRAFLAIPSVDPRLIPNGWVENHFKWIVWKLASMDRSKFADVDLPRALTPGEVIAQLKYRYDCEIDRVQRPAVRKILEKDDVPSKRMVLCVSSILEHNEVQNVNTSPKPAVSSIKKLILTDGWYSIPASVDRTMLKHISSGKVKEGTKLVIYGAELLNCDQGCFPLEAPGDVCLRIHTNSTRRARWDAKLGYTIPSRPIPTKLKNICPNGGLIGKLMVVVARVYPLLYYEKTPSGESIFRNAKCEEKACLSYERECGIKIEAFYAKAENQFNNPKKSVSSSSSDPDSMELAATEWNGDYEKLLKEENLSNEDRKRLLDQCRLKEEEFKKKLQSRLQASLPPPRQVKPLLKVRVMEGEMSSILSIWVPSEDVVDMMKEGSSLCLYNISSSGLRAGELQLSAGRNTLFIPKSTCNVNYPRRICSPLCEIGNPLFSPAYNEFDTVGIVVYIGSGPYAMKHFEAAYLACPNKGSSESLYLSVLFWQGIAAHGYAEMLTPGSLIACSNLEKRRAVSSNIPIAYCTERTVFTRNPRQNHFSQALSELRTMKVDVPAYVRKCAEELAEEIVKKPLPKTPDCNLDKSVSEKINVVAGINNVTEQSPPIINSYAVRSSATQMRLDKLNYYGEPPKLSPIVLKTSKRVLQDFRSPVRSSNIKEESKP